MMEESLLPWQLDFVDSDEERRSKRKGRKQKSDDDDSYSSEDESDDDKPTRRGRRAAKSAVKGFTDAEVRRFIKSYKKFGRPAER